MSLRRSSSGAYCMTCNDPLLNHGEVSARLPTSLYDAMREHCERTGDSVHHVVQKALAAYLDQEHHTLFQVSTSGALVEGVYAGCMRVKDILRHGDFGLGTFDGLDGEGILHEGVCWRAGADGSVEVAPDDALAPFWTVTHFVSDTTLTLDGVTGWESLCARLDAARTSDNVFAAVRLSGTFDALHWRVARKSAGGADLVSATSSQAEFRAEAVDGVIVGFWTPTYARTLNVPGWHLHLLSTDRKHAGHVLDVRAARLKAEVHVLEQLHVALPETAEFMRADLSKDPAAALAIAEQSRGGEKPEQ